MDHKTIHTAIKYESLPYSTPEAENNFRYKDAETMLHVTESITTFVETGLQGSWLITVY